MQAFASEAEERKALQPTEPWPESERGEKKRQARIRNAVKSFWFFDRTYFPAEMYADGYFPPNSMMKAKVRHWNQPGVHIECGPRFHGKTITDKKHMAYELLSNHIQIGGTYSHTMPTSSNILRDIASLIEDNPRIMEDFGVHFAENNAEQIKFRTRLHGNWRYCAAFSEGRSVRGFSRLFGRPQKIEGDDIETLTSPLGIEHAKTRIKKVSEAFLSMSDGGVFIWNANNFDELCATNILLDEQKKGILNTHWNVHLYDAWNEQRNRPLWHERYNAETEEELMQLCRAKDYADWMGNFRQRPIPPDGITFPREHYAEWSLLPDDVRIVLYTDPNLSLYGKGDNTCILAYGYSPSTGCFYVVAVNLQSFSSSNALLDATMRMKGTFPKGHVFRIGFDGNVNQESNWTNNVRNWCLINQQPFPHIEYQKLNVDLFAKNLQAAYSDGKLFFPEGFAETEVGKTALRQFFTFAGKKANNPDDFPDALINAHELICSTGFVRVRRERGNRPPVESIADTYTF